MPETDPHTAARLELILEQLDALPTLPAVAMRLLTLTSDDRSEARQVIDLVRADPSLTAKVLAMCRSAGRGVREPITTVDRAVVMLGFDTIRNAVLSIKVLQTFADEPPTLSEPAKSAATGDETPPPGDPIRFSRAAFWRHSLAVAIASELIAERHKLPGVCSTDAFVCGLLHDIGKLTMEYLLPRSYQRVVELTEEHQRDIAEVERRVIGFDHHTVGKRLAEHWRLPHLIQDAIWLHGTPIGAMPELPHRTTVALVGVADLLVRQQHLGYSGNFDFSEDLDRKAADAGLIPERVREVVAPLHDELDRRAAAMGLGQNPSRSLFLESIMQANAVLGRLNTNLERHRRASAGQHRVLEAISRFQQQSTRPGRSVQDAVSAVVESAAGVLGRGSYAVLHEPAGDQPWVLLQYDHAARLVQSNLIERSDDMAFNQAHDDGAAASMMAEALPRIAPLLGVKTGVNWLRLPCGWGTVGVLLHDRRGLRAGPALEALRHCWGAAIAAAVQHQGARRLGEQLVELNRQLSESQEQVLRNQSMARLGQLAAGAAHEMNNPLAVISGRGQLLAMKLGTGTVERKAAEQIVQQSQKLSDLITALRIFAEPPRPRLAPTTAAAVLEEALRLTRRREPEFAAMKVSGVDSAMPLVTDVEQLAAAVSEVLINAHQAQPHNPVRVRATVDPLNDRFILQVIDDGVGMDAATLEHAFDPFFSVKPAGRQSGLGLSRAQRLIESLGGEVQIVSRPGEGTAVRIALPMGAAGRITPPAQQASAV